MKKTKKCYECKKDTPIQQLIIVEDISKHGNLITKSYCSIECRDKKDNQKKLITKIKNLIETIIEIDNIEHNHNFKKIFSKFIKSNDNETIYYILLSNKDYIEKYLKSKKFYNDNAKINYFFAILQTKLQNHKTQSQNTIISKSEPKIDTTTSQSLYQHDYIVKEQFVTHKRSIFDIE
jgi:hypothetical protein